MTLESNQLVEALRAVGDALRRRGVSDPIRVLIAGGSAGLLSGLLDKGRVTGDCDVIGIEPSDQWFAIERATAEVAGRLGLPERWMNRDCARYAHCLAFGWRQRSVEIDQFGSLVVCTLSRIDLIASKIVSAPGRPQDVQDLLTMRPTDVELDFAERNLDRLENESLDGRTYEDERAVAQSLKGTP